MLHLTARLFERQPVIAALQGPNQFFLGVGNCDVGYGWITNDRPTKSIRLHHEMVSHVADEAGKQFSIPPERRLLVGFSQSVGLNYRFVATHPDAVRRVIGICGGLPGDWDDGAYPAGHSGGTAPRQGRRRILSADRHGGLCRATAAARCGCRIPPD
jgi:hypothetical protein